MNLASTTTNDAQRPMDKNSDRVAALADELGCFTEADLLVLGGITPSTAESWRKRGRGPAHIILGNRVLYPKAAMREYLSELQQARGIDPRTLL